MKMIRANELKYISDKGASRLLDSISAMFAGFETITGQVFLSKDPNSFLSYWKSVKNLDEETEKDVTECIEQSHNSICEEVKRNLEDFSVRAKDVASHGIYEIVFKAKINIKELTEETQPKYMQLWIPTCLRFFEYIMNLSGYDIEKCKVGNNITTHGKEDDYFTYTYKIEWKHEKEIKTV